MARFGSLRRKRRSIASNIKGVTATEGTTEEERAEAAEALHETIMSDKTGPKMVSQIVQGGGVEALTGLARDEDDEKAAIAVADLIQLITKGDKANVQAVIELDAFPVFVDIAATGGPKARETARRGLELETYEAKVRKYVQRAIAEAHAALEGAATLSANTSVNLPVAPGSSPLFSPIVSPRKNAEGSFFEVADEFADQENKSIQTTTQ